MRHRRPIFNVLFLLAMAASVPLAAFAQSETLLPPGETKPEAVLQIGNDADSEAVEYVLLNESMTAAAAVAPSRETDKSTQTKLLPGERFPVMIDSCATSKTAQVGDVVEAHLSEDLIIGDKIVATKGTLVKGHVCSVQKARKVLKAELSKHRWLKSAGELGVQFDEIVTAQNEHIPLNAVPAKQARFVKDMNEGRVLGINGQGEITSPLSSQLKSQSIHLGIHVAVTAAGIAGGPIGLGVIPATYACIGFINPSFAFMHPVGKNMKHRRIKGFALGLIAGVPGGGIIADAIVRGPEAIIQPGDAFQAELKNEFTGEKAVSADMEQLPNGTATVHGQIIPTSTEAPMGDQKSKAE